MVIPRVGLPEGAVGSFAIAAGVVVLVLGARAFRAMRRHERASVLALAVIAALLSWGYVHAYLRGGPRIIDATSYWLEARALASGYVSWPTLTPETATLGRFLVRSEDLHGARAAVLFPPGYPLLLAVGFLLGAPLLVGPILAALLVLATYALAREVTKDHPRLADVPLLSAGLSVVCGALRYHTADTMSHGLSALCMAAALTCALRAVGSPAESSRPRSAMWACLSGLAGGWLFATRPITGIACAIPIALILYSRPNPGLSRPARARLFGASLLGAIPFVVVFIVLQHLATGHFLTSTHAESYATNDGPAGCFRYGFGEGVGCYGEHADFVRANLPDGFGFVAAVKTTARRLWMHLVDAANAEPLALLVPFGAAALFRTTFGARVLALGVLAQIAAYVPFYFDGNYPGGGARFYADVLPLEHVLLAMGVVCFAHRDKIRSPSGADRWPGAARGGALIVGLALIGFALRAEHDHAQLRDRDGGAPLFSASALTAAGVTDGLLFVDTDAAYNLAFDPGARPPSGSFRGQARGLDVVRWKGDALDLLAWRERGSPPSFRARFEIPSGGGPGRTVVTPFAVPLDASTIEGESLWPPVLQEGGAYVLPSYAGGECASARRVLRLLRSGAGGDGSVRLSLPSALVAGSAIGLFVVSEVAPSHGTVRAVVTVVADGDEIARADLDVPSGAGPTCAERLRALVPQSARRVSIVLSPKWDAGGDPERQPLVGLDRIVAQPTVRKSPANSH